MTRGGVIAGSILSEEPTLSGTCGEQYARYRAKVRRWLPRLTPRHG